MMVYDRARRGRRRAARALAAEDGRMVDGSDRHFQVMTLPVYAPGCRVEIGTHKSPVKAMVLEASIGAEGAVRYRVAWWDGHHRRQDWLDSCEIVWAPEAPQIDVVQAGG